MNIIVIFIIITYPIFILTCLVVNLIHNDVKLACLNANSNMQGC